MYILKKYFSFEVGINVYIKKNSEKYRRKANYLINENTLIFKKKLDNARENLLRTE